MINKQIIHCLLILKTEKIMKIIKITVKNEKYLPFNIKKAFLKIHMNRAARYFPSQFSVSSGSLAEISNYLSIYKAGQNQDKKKENSFPPFTGPFLHTGNIKSVYI